jgi:hypothetical protein
MPAYRSPSFWGPSCMDQKWALDQVRVIRFTSMGISTWAVRTHVWPGSIWSSVFHFLSNLLNLSIYSSYHIFFPMISVKPSPWIVHDSPAFWEERIVPMETKEKTPGNLIGLLAVIDYSSLTGLCGLVDACLSSSAESNSCSPSSELCWLASPYSTQFQNIWVTQWI